MNIDDAINRLSNCNPITKEDEEIFKCAVECMKFVRDFMPLNASPERMKHALNFLNSLEYIFSNVKTKENQKPITSIPDDIVDESFKEILVNKTCQSESDHEWECIGMSTVGTTYLCKKCYTQKIYPYEHNKTFLRG